NGIKFDNRPENLEWVTGKKNRLHAAENGLWDVRGEKSGVNKLKNEDVIYIRNTYKCRNKEFGARALSQKYNVDQSLIYFIVNRKIWKHI
ncbi:MAG: hypothetical protein AABY22_29570, partial [Nanoarchaeota archaeon]